MDKLQKRWILIFTAVIIAGLLFLLPQLFSDKGNVAVISVDGKEYRRIDLSRVKESYDIELSGPYGYNRIRVSHGAIEVTEANCPDKVCVNMGRLKIGGGLPIACVPHRLIISIEGGGELDG